MALIDGVPDDRIRFDDGQYVVIYGDIFCDWFGRRAVKAGLSLPSVQNSMGLHYMLSGGSLYEKYKRWYAAGVQTTGARLAGEHSHSFVAHAGREAAAHTPVRNLAQHAGPAKRR